MVVVVVVVLCIRWLGRGLDGCLIRSLMFFELNSEDLRQRGTGLFNYFTLVRKESSLGDTATSEPSPRRVPVVVGLCVALRAKKSGLRGPTTEYWRRSRQQRWVQGSGPGRMLRALQSTPCLRVGSTEIPFPASSSDSR
ncbi:hypothetical protein QBC39DRAFT_350209 [Podospora conica]|nr:hypothetical protein QBC39DRAFT_350209 [Schizothecium conicum]